MQTPPVPDDESLRLAAIERYKLGGIGREAAFDHVTRLAADLFDVPISLVSIVGSDMQCFRGACGLDSSGTPRDVAFCAFAILDPDVTVVRDASTDPRFADNPPCRRRALHSLLCRRPAKTWRAGCRHPLHHRQPSAPIQRSRAPAAGRPGPDRRRYDRIARRGASPGRTTKGRSKRSDSF